MRPGRGREVPEAAAEGPAGAAARGTSARDGGGAGGTGTTAPVHSERSFKELRGDVPVLHRGAVLIRRERGEDADPVRAVHTAAFADPERPDDLPVEVGLVEALREDEAWLPPLSMVAVDGGGEVVGHVTCTRAHLGSAPVLGLGPLGVLPDLQGGGIGSALMHAVLGAADALDESLVGLLGHTGYYPRFGFRPSTEFGVAPPDPEWGEHFQVRPLTAYDPEVRGEFVYAQPFRDL